MEVSNALNPLEITQNHEVERLIHERMALLSQEHRDAIQLFHLDGHTQQEISDFLDVPISTVKKRLYDARKHLKKRMMTMAPTNREEKRPSQDDGFKHRVQFFIALHTRDFDALDKLITEDASLLEAKTDPDAAPERYWSRDITAILWAVQNRDEELSVFLMERGANLNEKDRSIGTSLHYAAMMGEHRIAEQLIKQGVDVDAVAGCKQTALHRAAIVGDRPMVELLVASCVDLEAKDAEERTATDWAAVKSRREVLDCLLENGAQPPTSAFAGSGSCLIPESTQNGLLGRIIDADGKPLDERGEIKDLTILPAENSGRVRSKVLETGIKLVDLFAPIKRGGSVGREFGLGVCGMLLSGQIIHNLVTRDNVRVVYIVAPEVSQGPAAVQLREYWWFTGNAFRNGIVFVVADPNDSNERLRATVGKGFRLAENFRSAGYDVLVKLQGQLYPHADLDQLRSGSDENGSITIMYSADPPDGLSAISESFDSVVCMSPQLAAQGLYPAIDYQLSHSVLLEDGTFDQAHIDTVNTVRRRAYEYNQFNLGTSYKKDADNFLYMNDGGVTVERMKRTRLLGMFLTQSYHGTEM